MGGFLGFFDYNKPGPGVPKEEHKSAVVVLFEIYMRKFWNLAKLNLMFFVFNLPALLSVLYLSQIYMKRTLSDSLGSNLVSGFMLGTVFLCIPIITVGPAQAGFTYVLRNYARQEHAWIWSDFKEHALKNFKQSLIICLIDFVVVLIVGIDINVYLAVKNANVFVLIGSGFLILSFIMYLMMHMYIYPMLVTFNLNVRQIYKNALIFAAIKFLPNLGMLVLCIGILIASFLVPFIGFVLFPTIMISTIGLITNFYVYPNLKKYMIDNAPSEENVKSAKSNV